MIRKKKEWNEKGGIKFGRFLFKTVRRESDSIIGVQYLIGGGLFKASDLLMCIL